MDDSPENRPPTNQAARKLRVPVALVARLAGIVGQAMEHRPETLAPYLNAAEQSGQAYASQSLWCEIAHEEQGVAEVWSRIRRGDVSDPIAARHAFMLLLALDGWSRVKVCDHPRCRRAFADATNAVSRRRCARHTRQQSRA
ncbi:CGNR zinc finger domain-containing protein [Nesterenkonia ebinurensis]|uniref:hypothetical protein n=1 Tax=Nesterenkonia ebinurensis TaxID=2608252 RepID=UPI00123D58E7|nr:hypothetical protein [Nesterenkonia ebinurensis]